MAELEDAVKTVRRTSPSSNPAACAAATRSRGWVDVDQWRALAVRDRSCVIERCDADSRLQRDHRVPFARGGPTEIDNLGNREGTRRSMVRAAARERQSGQSVRQ